MLVLFDNGTPRTLARFRFADRDVLDVDYVDYH